MEYIEQTDDKRKKHTTDWILDHFLYRPDSMLSLMEMLIERGISNNEIVSILLEGYLEEEIEDGEFDLPRMVAHDELLLYLETSRSSAILTYMKFKDFYPILEKKIHSKLKPQPDSYYDISEEDRIKILEKLAEVKTSFGLDN